MLKPCCLTLFLAAHLAGSFTPVPAQEHLPAVQAGVSTSFVHDPRDRADVRIEGAALERLSWAADEPAFPGDRPGSLTALYDALWEPGRFGFMLDDPLDQDDAFTAAAVFSIGSTGFTAHPEGFFEISWGLWNTAETGLDRTGDLSDFAADTFEVLEFAWFPNISPFFGGPYLSPALFGAADENSPSFPFLGGFANFAFGSVEAAIPLDTPLLAVLEHDPQQNAVTVSVHEIAGGHKLVPVAGAVAVVDLSMLGVRRYTLDAVGLTLWRDGCSGAEPSLRAEVTFHQLSVFPGLVQRLESLLQSPPAGKP